VKRHCPNLVRLKRPIQIKYKLTKNLN